MLFVFSPHTHIHTYIHQVGRVLDKAKKSGRKEKRKKNPPDSGVTWCKEKKREEKKSKEKKRKETNDSWGSPASFSEKLFTRIQYKPALDFAGEEERKKGEEGGDIYNEG